MITLTYKFMDADLPLTISKEHLVAFFMQYKGKAFELIESLLIELLKDDSDISKIKIKEIEKLIRANRYK